MGHQRPMQEAAGVQTQPPPEPRPPPGYPCPSEARRQWAADLRTAVSKGTSVRQASLDRMVDQRQLTTAVRAVVA